MSHGLVAPLGIRHAFPKNARPVISESHDDEVLPEMVRDIRPMATG